MKKEFFIISIMAVLLTISFSVNESRRQSIVIERFNLASNVMLDEIEDVNQVNKFINGIDFDKPVGTHQIKKGEQFIQYQLSENPQGNWYGKNDSTPDCLGINGENKEKRTYVANKDFVVLYSYAAPITDDWSTPEDESQTSGSCKQFFTTCKECFNLIIKEGEIK
jgi:hypothetical protein